LSSYAESPFLFTQEEAVLLKANLRTNFDSFKIVVGEALKQKSPGTMLNRSIEEKMAHIEAEISQILRQVDVTIAKEGSSLLPMVGRLTTTPLRDSLVDHGTPGVGAGGSGPIPE
jgi:hypothetical protein